MLRPRGVGAGGLVAGRGGGTGMIGLGPRRGPRMSSSNGVAGGSDQPPGREFGSKAGSNGAGGGGGVGETGLGGAGGVGATDFGGAGGETFRGGAGGTGIGASAGEPVEIVSSADWGLPGGVSRGLNAPEEAFESLLTCTRRVLISVWVVESQIFTVRSRLLDAIRSPSGE